MLVTIGTERVKKKTGSSFVHLIKTIRQNAIPIV